MRRAWLTLRIVLVVLLGPLPHATAAVEPDRLDVVATVDDGTAPPVDLLAAGANDPLVLWPDRDYTVRLQITNPGDTPVLVRRVVLDGEVLDLTFFGVGTQTSLPVPPGEQAEFVLPLDFAPIADQAAGYLPASLRLLGEDSDVLWERDFAVDVRGRALSTYVVFGLLVGLAAALLLGAALVRLALGRLPRHRWLRAARFGVVGVALGLALTFTLSVLRLVVPSPGSWLSIVVAGGLIGLVVGFLTPTPTPAGAGRTRRVLDLDRRAAYEEPVGEPAERVGADVSPAPSAAPAPSGPQSGAGPVIHPQPAPTAGAPGSEPPTRAVRNP